MNKTSHSISPQEECKFLEGMLSENRIEKINKVLDHRTNYVTLVADRVIKEHNLAAITRTADAFGLTCVHYIGQAITLNEGISMGTSHWVDLVVHKNPHDAINELKNKNFQIVVLSADSDATPKTVNADGMQNSNTCRSKAVPFNTISFNRPTALVFGNEVQGVSAEFINQADCLAYIPMCGFVESLNVSVAAGICLVNALTLAKLHLASLGKTYELSAEEKLQLKLAWLKRHIYRKI